MRERERESESEQRERERRRIRARENSEEQKKEVCDTEAAAQVFVCGFAPEEYWGAAFSTLSLSLLLVGCGAGVWPHKGKEENGLPPIPILTHMHMHLRGKVLPAHHAAPL